MLHLAATLGNALLCMALFIRCGWSRWKWVFWAQLVSMGLLVGHNWMLYHVSHATFRRWWFAFDIANVLVEIAYLMDLRAFPLTFSVFAALVIETCIEYGVFEAGNRTMANQMLFVRQWCDCGAIYLLSWVILSAGGLSNARRTQEEADSPPRTSPASHPKATR